jgi:endonuclease/exonuclease/phosphatase family metal-dependent hydrolase
VLRLLRPTRHGHGYDHGHGRPEPVGSPGDVTAGARRPVAAVLLGVVAVIAGLAASGGLFAERAPAQTRPDGIRLVQFNMCGQACNDGHHLAAGAVDALADYRPDAVSLNEVCRGQLGAVVSGLRSRGWAMDARFLVTAPRACDGGDYGIAVLTRSRVVDTDRLTYREQSPGTVERRGLLCVQAALGGRPTRVCSTHLVSAREGRSANIRRGQLVAAARLTGSYRLPVVLMGDFNMAPDDPGMTALYAADHAGSSGAFDEVDQGRDVCRCGASTHSSGTKLDYVFVTARDFTARGASVVYSASSDHDVLRGVVTAR